MTDHVRRLLAGTCAAVLGVAVTSFVLLAVRDWIFQQGVAVSIVGILLPYAICGLVTASLYSWAVDGSFLPRRGRPRRTP